jgi:hypothetical protein
MKLFFLLISLVFLVTNTPAQSKRIDSISRLPEIKQSYYEMGISGCKVMYLQMDYGKSNFTINQQMAVDDLKNATIAGIDLVYSDFPTKADFSVLNKKRFETLKKILPSVFLNSLGKTSFRKIRQTSARNKTEAGYLQHGFFIYYRPKADTTLIKSELKKLAHLIKKPAVTKADGYSIDSGVKYCTVFSFYTDTTGYIHPLRENFVRKTTKIAVRDIYADKIYEEKFFKEYYNEASKFDSVFYVLDINKDSCDFFTGVYNYDSFDTTVSAVFKRHNWDKAMVIADVTGSMYPYTSQLLLWLKLKTHDGLKRSFIFFNDGDDTPDEKKINGKTGGIYPIATSKYEEVEEVIIKAMKAGCGGDAPENNIEALLTADKLCGTCDTIVMIADNWAPVKDIKLIAALKKPVKIILCGVYGAINPDYLNIARKTKGSIHLIEKDIYELSKMHEGDMIEISGRKYKIVDGEFKEIVKKII